MHVIIKRIQPKSQIQLTLCLHHKYNTMVASFLPEKYTDDVGVVHGLNISSKITRLVLRVVPIFILPVITSRHSCENRLSKVHNLRLMYNNWPIYCSGENKLLLFCLDAALVSRF